MYIWQRLLKLTSAVIHILLTVLFLSACSLANGTGIGNATAVMNSPFPKPGHWVGENKEPGEARVSFDLLESGLVTNFILTASIRMPPSSCEITVREAPLDVDKEGGIFVLSYMMEYEELEKQLGAAVMSLGVIPKGEPYEVLHIEGTASETMLTGIYTLRACGPTLYFQPETGAWNPQWKQP
jgi:hypothetical protein